MRAVVAGCADSVGAAAAVRAPFVCEPREFRAVAGGVNERQPEGEGQPSPRRAVDLFV